MLNLKIIIGRTRPGRAAGQRATTLRQARSAGTLPPAIMRLMGAAT